MSEYDRFIDTWSTATDLVADALDGGVTFEWPGTIDVLVTPRLLLTYGAVNDTINAEAHYLDGDTWQPLEEWPASLTTDVPSSSNDPRLIAEAVIASVRAYTREVRP